MASKPKRHDLKPGNTLKIIENFKPQLPHISSHTQQDRKTIYNKTHDIHTFLDIFIHLINTLIMHQPTKDKRKEFSFP